MDDDPSPNSAHSEASETSLLLANLDLAVRSLQQNTESTGGVKKSLLNLEQALHTYGTIKHLLPKLQLTAAERAPVETQLQRLRALIVATDSGV